MIQGVQLVKPSHHYIALYNKNGQHKWQEITDFERITVAGIPAVIRQRFCYRARSLDSGLRYLVSDRWAVDEPTVGMTFGRGPTREEAIQDALATLNTLGVEDFARRVIGTAEVHGLSPCFRMANPQGALR